MSDHDARLADLARELPTHDPDDARREAVRASLLAAASADHAAPRPRWRLIATGFAAGALAAAAVALIVLRSQPRPPAAPREIAAAHIDAPPDASFERELVHDGSGHVAELVRIHAGALHVASAHPGELLSLATADARVGGSGEVDVEVAGDQLRAVTVRSGSATLRVRDQQVIVLAAGQTWKAPVITAQVDVMPPAPVVVPAVPAPASAYDPVTATPAPAHVEPAHVESAHVESAHAEPAPAPAQTPAAAEPIAETPSVPSATRTASPTEQHFAAGWGLLKQGKSAEAARELGIAADSDGDAALAADARYFQAIALTRAGRKTEAEHALVAFLDHAPKSIRRGRASVMLAKLIAERGDTKSARAWFESALGDADPAVVAAARAGLAAR